jgi:hypothetical protein
VSDEYEPLLLSTPAALAAFWPLAEPLLRRAIAKAVNGEFTLEHLYAQAVAGKVSVFVLTNDKRGVAPPEQRKVKLAMVVEVINYPSLAALNIVIMGGSGLRQFWKMFWQQFSGWAYMNGIRVVEGWVSPSMQRVTSSLGFSPVYTKMRFALTGSGNE